MTISSSTPAAQPQLREFAAGRTAARGARLQSRETKDPKLQEALEVKEAFTQFVGEAFFGQMIQAMRSSVGEPAYFHGGRAEQIFQGQLDQRLAEELSHASADKIAEPMFARQFPHLAALLSKPPESEETSRLDVSG